MDNDWHIETATGNLIAVVEDRANFDFQIETELLHTFFSLRPTENNPLFNPEFYLLKYPSVQEAINSGMVESAYEHFEKIGHPSGLTEISRYYEESFYLENNPDVIPLIDSGMFASGLDHFLQVGYEQGRTMISPSYNEEFYVAYNPDVQSFIENGTFKTGLQYFLQITNSSQAPSSIGISFDGQETLVNDNHFSSFSIQEPNSIKQAISEGEFKTSFDYYLKVGQFDPNLTARFARTRGNDVISGVGIGRNILSGAQTDQDDNGQYYDNPGANEFDILIGGPGENIFLLSDATQRTFLTTFQANYAFYLGEGFATLRNFDPDKDRIQLLNGRQLLQSMNIEVEDHDEAGNALDQNGNFILDNNGNPLSLNDDLYGYNVFANQNDLHIATFNGDLLGIIEGGANLVTDLSFFTVLG